MPDEPQIPPNPTPHKLMGIAFFAGVIALIVALSFGYADHDPKPHDVRLAVAAPAPVTRQLSAGLDHAAPGGFRVVSAGGRQDVLDQVRSQSASGGLVVPASGPLTIVTAAASGVSQQQTITAVLSAAAKQMGRPTLARDVAPLSSGDRAGLSSFVFELALLIPSMVGSIGLFLIGMRSRLWWRVAAGALFALLAALAVTLAMDTVLGALTGAGGELIGVGFLGALSFVLFVATLQAVVGLPGTGMAALAFVFVGNAISGGSVAVGFLPNVFRQVAPWLPNNAIIRAVRDVVYYGGHDLGHPMLVLGLWVGVSLAVLAAVDLLHSQARRRTPHLAAEIYRTPGLVHLRRALRPVEATTLATAAGPTAAPAGDGPRLVRRS